MSNKLAYTEDQLIEKPLSKPYSSEYGPTIPTTKVLKHNGQLFRVYYQNHNNVETTYIIDGNKKLLLVHY